MKWLRIVGDWLREVIWLRDQRRKAVRALEQLGFDKVVLSHLAHRDLMRLARWTAPRLTWADVVMGFLIGMATSLILVERSPDYRWGWSLVMAVVFMASCFALFVSLLSAALNPWINRAVDYYYEFGRSGGRIIRTLWNEESSELFRKERAVRAAHAWSRAGRRGGVDFEARRDRVFAMLTQVPVTGAVKQRICDDVRKALLDAIAGKIDPERYQEPRRFWNEREHVEFLNLRITLIVTVIGLLAVAGLWPET
jgi:hypothetical protein